ncbi:hypothetical protein K7432_009463 [Basidiobolus ranarum]|uniref:Uncharacterized protein n=1 Tax=Basidiobolus ranarum TaxID=34480 RepID=A0ABR2VX17_9FUNG
MDIKIPPFSHIPYLILVICFGSSHSSYFSNSQLIRRADTSVCGPDIYCLPKTNDTWVMSSVEVIRWNSEYPTFAVQGTVDIRLYDVTDMRKPVLERLNTTNGKGYMNLTLDPNLQPPIFAPVLNRPKNFTAIRMYCFLITVAGDDIVNKPNGPYFYIQDPPPLSEALPSVAPIPSATVPTDSTNTATPDPPIPIPIDTSNQKDSYYHGSMGLTSGAIAGISIGCVSVLAAAGIYLFI